MAYSANALPQNGFHSIGKPPVDSAAIRKWPSLGSPVISDDGQYFSYNIDNQPVGSNTVIVQDTDRFWKKQFMGVNNGFFSADNKQFISFGNDTLCFHQLGTEQFNFITNVSSCKRPKSGKGEWLVS